MRYLLTPLTMAIWFVLTYSSIYYGILLMIWLHSLSWIWLILGYSILISVIHFIVSGLPSVINFLILRLYRFNWFSILAHSISGLLGIVYILIFLNQNPIESVSSTETTPIIKALWNESWLKTLLLLPAFAWLQFEIINSAVIRPNIMKLEKSHK